MVFPVWAENFQVKYFNPLIKPFARYLPGMATIKHRGRKSGKPYETIVTAYRKGNVLAIALGHGKTDWVKNVLAAGEADVHFIRRDVHIVNPRILPAGASADGCRGWHGCSRAKSECSSPTSPDTLTPWRGKCG